MSDEEEVYDEEVEEEEVEEAEEEEVAAVQEDAPAKEATPPAVADSAPAAVPQDGTVEEAPKLRRAPKQEEQQSEAVLTEAEQAMLAAKKRHEEEEAARIVDYEQKRLAEREQVEQELVELKQRQQERKAQRDQEEREFAQRRREDEEKRRKEEEERKNRIEAERTRREEEKLKRQQPGRNFTITKKERSDAPGGKGGGESKRGRTAEEIATAKNNYLASVNRPVDVSNLLPNDLKAKIKQLHAKIVRLEGEKFDLEQRNNRLDYDLKELRERESQTARKKAIERVASKFDRQPDTRSYGERRDKYEKPVVIPPKSIARGTARPPEHWGRKNNEELENIRKNVGPFKYVEQVQVEGARPPVEPKPLQLPSSDSVYDEEEEEEEVEEVEETEAPAAPKEAEAAPEKEEGEGEEEEGGDENEEPAEEDKPRKERPPPPPEPERDPASMTEAELAMMAAKKRHEEEQEAKLADYEQKRLLEKEQIEQELVELKQRQIERRQQREQEEREFAERRKQDEERRRHEEEERKARMEAERARRDEEKQKRQQRGRNFTIQKGEGGGEKQEQDGKAPTGRKGPSAEQKAEAKRNYMSIVGKPVDTSNMLPNDLKAKIKQLHAKIEYDLKELSERQKQVARQKAIKAGNEPVAEESGNMPPKVNVASKFDRQVDRRGYGEKRDLFENPLVKPPPSIVHGTARPPPEWGRKPNDELENIRKNLEAPKYTEVAPVEGDAAKPPVQPIPLQIPAEDFDASAPQKPQSSKASQWAESRSYSVSEILDDLEKKNSTLR
ncbi:Tnt-2 [Aphelenchoides fujianensis]|nr:Tnt-2 [Aphelenchoides fujianensis]